MIGSSVLETAKGGVELGDVSAAEQGGVDEQGEELIGVDPAFEERFGDGPDAGVAVEEFLAAG